MAKILDKIKHGADSLKNKVTSLPTTLKNVQDNIKTSFTHSKLIKLRRNLDYLKNELENIDAKYQSKIEDKKHSLINAANASLARAAFKACDKNEYISAVINEKLIKFDKRQYMSFRAVNTKTAKNLFKAQKENLSTQEILKKHEESIANLYKKRDAYLAKLDKEREKFIEKHKETSDELYKSLSAELEKQYNTKISLLENKLNAKKQQETESIKTKIQKIEEQIKQLVENVKVEHEMPKDVVLRVKNLKMYFGGLKAVDDLTFDVKKGEIFGLIGPNGAGKTTVFNCITRFYNATAGDILFENKYGEVIDMRAFKVHDVVLNGISRTFQNIELVREISVVENLLVACTRNYRSNMLVHALGLSILKKEEKMFKQKAMQILKFMGIENYAGWYAMGLPYGILKKVEIARALMADPKLIIMDEPAAGLNDAETKELTETIKKIRDTFGVTILLVEHDMGLVMNVCDTVCAISFGQMLAVDTAQGIQKNKQVQEAYLGVAEEEQTKEVQ